MVVQSSQVDTTCCELPWQAKGGHYGVKEEEREVAAVGGAGVVEEVLVEMAHRCKQEWNGLLRSTAKGTVSKGRGTGKGIQGWGETAATWFQWGGMF
jgi:hypothetical protein